MECLDYTLRPVNSILTMPSIIRVGFSVQHNFYPVDWRSMNPDTGDLYMSVNISDFQIIEVHGNDLLVPTRISCAVYNNGHIAQTLRFEISNVDLSPTFDPKVFEFPANLQGYLVFDGDSGAPISTAENAEIRREYLISRAEQLSNPPMHADGESSKTTIRRILLVAFISLLVISVGIFFYVARKA